MSQVYDAYDTTAYYGITIDVNYSSLLRKLEEQASATEVRLLPTLNSSTVNIIPHDVVINIQSNNALVLNSDFSKLTLAKKSQ